MIPPIFTQGLREILVIDRSSKNTCLWNKIARYPDMYEQHIAEAISACKSFRKPDIRVYMSINSRCVDKAIREFKRQQIEADYSPHNKDWYLNLNKQFRHILMQPKQRKTKYFLMDIDTKERGTMHIVDQFIRDKGIETITSYDTPNGCHIITEPFNMNMCKLDKVEVKTDALLLLYSNQTGETFHAHQSG